MKNARTIRGFVLYVLLCFVPLFAILINSLYYNSVLDKMFTEKSQTSESFLSKNITDTLSSVRHFSLNIIEECAPKVFLHNNSASTNFVRMLHEEVKNEPSVQGVFFFSKTSNTVTSDQGVYNINFYFRSMFSDDEAVYNTFLNSSQTTLANETLIEIPGTDGDYILYMLPLNVLSFNFTDSDIILCAIIDKSIFFPSKHTYGDMYIFNSSGKLLLSSATQKNRANFTTPDKLKNSTKDSVTKKSEIITGDRPSYVMYTIFPKGSYKSSVNKARNISTSIILIDIFISVFLLLMIAKKNYRPIINTMKLLDKNIVPYEYSVIETSVKNLLENNKTLSVELQEQKVLFRNAVLSRILNNELVDSTMFIADKHGVNFPHKKFFVLLLDVSLQKKTETVPLMLDGNYISSMENALRTKDVEPYILSYNDKYACIFNATVKKNHFADFASNIAEKLIQDIKTNHSAIITAGISQLHDSSTEIAPAYLEALEAVIYSGKNATAAPTFFDNITHNNKEYFLLDIKNRLISNIINNDELAATETLNELFDSADTIYNTEQIVQDVISMLLKVPYFFDIDEDDEISAKLNINFFKPYLKDIAQLKVIGEEIVKELITVSKKKKNDLSRDTIERALTFIQKNYSDPSLSVQDISNHVKLSTVQFTTQFKKSFNMTPGKYLNQYRIDIAKKLLEETDLSVNEIYLQVGYTNQRTFSRVFKQHVYVTASEYRKVLNSNSSTV